MCFFLGTLDEDTQEGMELEDLNADSDIPVEDVKDFLEKIDPELFNDDKGGIISEDISQCARTDLNKRFLPKPMTITGWKGTP